MIAGLEASERDRETPSRCPPAAQLARRRAPRPAGLEVQQMLLVAVRVFVAVETPC